MSADEDQDLSSASNPPSNWPAAPVNYELRSISQITAACKRLLGPGFDYESVATDIWVEAWFKHGCTNTALVPVPYAQIKRRCIDARRHKAVQHKHDEATELLATNDDSVNNVDIVSLVLDRASLTLNERAVVVRKFVNGESLAKIASEMGTKEYLVARTLAIATEKLRSAMRSTGDSSP